MQAAADLLFTTMQNKGKIFAFGSSHASMITQELYYRTGGLAIVNPIFAPGLTLEVAPVTLTSQIERLPGYGQLLAEQYHLKAGDALLIHSVSGRNSVSIDLALAAAELGVKTIALTSLAYSQGVTSRHPSGKLLYELCDIVIDNCGCYGDAAMEVEGFVEKVAPTSTVIGAAIVNGITLLFLERCLAEGIQPPILISGNRDGGDEYNAAVFRTHKEEIMYKL